MASQSASEPSPIQMCHLCQTSVPESAKVVHENGIHHQAAKQIAAVALDRWRAHMAASSLTDLIQDSDAVENAIFCEICTEAVPSGSYSKHLTARPHLISALDGQVFEELVREYIDEEDLKLLEAPTVEDEIDKNNAKTAYQCHICAVQVPSPFKSQHERSLHHRTRVALATAAARRTSAFLHNQTPIGVNLKRNMKLTELLKLYTGTDLSKNDKEEENEDVIDKEVVENASQVDIKKRMTAKQYFTDILPYLQYTEALYTIIVDDTEYVTVKNTNGTYMSVHVADFNGIYCDSGAVHYDLKCKMCNGYNQYMKYSSENDHDKLHVMSLGHIRHVLTPVDNVHGIRKLGNGQALCVVCNVFMQESEIEHHIFNDIHHTAAMAEALKRGRNFKEGKNDLKIVIYTSPPVDKTNYNRNYVRNFPHNNVGFGGGVGFPQGPVSRPQGGLFGVQNNLTVGSTSNTGTTFGSGPGNASFGASPASSGPVSTGFGASSAAFGSAPASTGFGFGSATSAPTSTATFGSASTVFTASVGTPKTLSFGGPVSTNNSIDSLSFGIKPAAGSIFGGPVKPGNSVFGASTTSVGGLFSTSNIAGVGTTNNAPDVSTTSGKDDASIHLKTISGGIAGTGSIFKNNPY